MNCNLLDSLLPCTDFESYEDFLARYRVALPATFNFGFDVVDALAARDPAGRALCWCNDAGEEADFTMAEIARQSARAANWFRSLGVRRGDAVMLILKRRYDYWFAVVGLHKLGAVAIPATHMLTKKDLSYRIRAAHVTMIVAVTEAGIADAIDQAVAETPVARLAGVGAPRPGWLDFRAGLAAASDRFDRPAGADAIDAGTDSMLLYFTSGTTGMPKMVQHNFFYPLGHILTARYWQDCRPGGLHFTIADTGWAKASWGKIYGQWIAGSAVMVYDMEKFSARRVLDVITKHRVTTFCAPPTMYRYFIREDLKSFDWSHLKHCTVAGEPLNPEVFEQFKAATGLALREGYGQTEMTVTLGTYPWMTPKPGSMGRPSPGYDVDLLDEHGQPCGAGQEGQIVVRTQARRPLGLFDGYYQDPELTRKVWRDGIYYTGDMAWRDEDGYYWFVGRSDDVIKSSGYRIGPFEVESALQEHPAVLECAVTGVPDEERGAVVKATIVLAGGFEPGEVLKHQLQEHVKKVTAPYKYPRVIEFVKELPKTISGKIRRVAIREDDHDRKLAGPGKDPA
jgi:acetyl-CoA synthetase